MLNNVNGRTIDFTKLKNVNTIVPHFTWNLVFLSVHFCVNTNIVTIPRSAVASSAAPARKWIIVATKLVRTKPEIPGVAPATKQRKLREDRDRSDRDDGCIYCYNDSSEKWISGQQPAATFIYDIQILLVA